MRSLFASTCLTPIVMLAIAVPLRAETLVDTKRTTPIATATAKAGAADDIRITTAGGVAPTSGAAVTLNSANKITNEGTIQVTGANDATGILAVAGATGGITNSGKIILDEVYAPVDSDKDGDIDGPLAQGARRIGIHTAGAFTGNIVSSGSIVVQGNDSAGVALDGTLTGSLDIGGTITVTGDRSVGVRTGAIGGAARIAGAITAQGQGASAAVIQGDVGGALVVQGALVATGYRATVAPADVSKLDADDLLQGGPALSIAGNVAGGVILAVAPRDLDPKNLDEDKDGIADAVEGAAAVTSYGAAAAVQVGAATRAVTIGAVAGSNYGFVIDGSVAGLGVYKDVEARGLTIGGLGGTVAIAGGIAINGAVQASSLNVGATAIRIGSGASVPDIRIAGSVLASGAGKAGTASTAIAVDAGATVASLHNSGQVKATAVGVDGAATAIIDRSGSLALIENSGSIVATGAGAGRNIAIDLRANAGGAIVRQVAGAAGAAAAGISGDILFGSGADTFALAGKSTYAGNVDFGGGADQLSLADASRFTGSLANAQGLAVSVANGTLALNNAGSVAIASLSVGTQGVLGIAVDGTAHTSTMFQVAGAASFATGSQVAVTLNHVGNAEGRYVIVRAGSVSGAGNLGTSAAVLPFLFKSSITTGAPNEVVLDLKRKSATELGLNGSQTRAYEAIVKALDSDAKVASAILDIGTSARFGATLQQLLPDHAGGTFESVTQASRATARLVADASLPAQEIGSARMWLQQVGWGTSKKLSSTAAYDVSGFGFSGGAETQTDLGSFGGSLALLFGSDADGGTDNVVNSSQYEVAGYWRGDWGGLQANARVSAAHIAFKGKRQFNGSIGSETVARTAEGKWNGKLLSASAATAYQFDLNRLSLRPIAAIDYYWLDEGGYAESGGGKAIDLSVDSRKSDELAASATIAAGLRFGGKSSGDTWIRAEIEGGRRQIIGGALGATTARFTGGQSFTLLPEARTSGWVGKIRGVGGNDNTKFAGEFSAEQQQGRAAVAVRASITFGI